MDAESNPIPISHQPLLISHCREPPATPKNETGYGQSHVLENANLETKRADQIEVKL